MKNPKLTHLLIVAAAIGAMLLPWGAVLRFISSDESGLQHEKLETFSYFDPTIYGYANFAPFLCAIVTVLLLVLVGYTFFGTENKPVRVTMFVLSLTAFVLSVLPLPLYGFPYFTTTAMLISFLLACSVIISLQRLTGKLFLPAEKEEQEEQE